MPDLRLTIPVFQVRDVVASAAFYEDKLGMPARHQEEGFAIVRRGTAEINLTRADDEAWRRRPGLAERPVVSGAESFLAGTGACRVEVTGIDDLYAELKEREIVHPNGPLRDQWWGDRDFSVTDLDGNLITFFERGQDKTDPDG